MTPSFEIKGRALVTTLRLVERDVPGGLATLGLDDPDRAHFEGIFLASSWYPLEPYLRLVERLAALQRRPLRAWMRDQARRTARLDVEKRDRAALAARDPEDMARRLPRAFNRYFRPTHAALESVGPGEARFVLVRVPADHRDFFLGSNDGFCAGAFAELGRRARLEYLPERPESTRGSVPTLTIPFVLRW